MQLINMYRGAVDVVGASDDLSGDKQEHINKMKFVVDNALNDIDNLGPDNIKKYNTQMMSVLTEDANPKVTDAETKDFSKDMLKRVKFASELSNFKDTHRHITTLTSVLDDQGKKQVSIKAEIMMNGLTEKQKNNYESIARGDVAAVPWFNELGESQQKMLQERSDGISKGKHIIPTQLLGSVEGVRNAYMQVVAVKVDSQSIEILGENIHCGAPATKVKFAEKDQQTEMAKSAIEQLQEFEPNITLNILNSKTPGNARGENFIFDQIESAQKELKEEQKSVGVAASPINRWRGLGGGRDTKAFEDVLNKIGQDVEKHHIYINVKNQGPTRLSLKNTSKLLQGGGSSFFDKAMEQIGGPETIETKAKREVSRIPNPDVKNLLTNAIEARMDIDTPSILSPFRNVNLDVSSRMSQIDNAINNRSDSLKDNGMTLKEAKDTPKIVTFCKSGKDRTGLDIFAAAVKAVKDKIGGRFAEKNQMALAADGHTQIMAEVQGGSIGCGGVKFNPEFGVDVLRQKTQKWLGKASAKFNNIKLEKGEDANQSINELKTNYENFQKTENNRKPQVQKEKGTEISPPKPAAQLSRANSRANKVKQSLKNLKNSVKNLLKGSFKSNTEGKPAPNTNSKTRNSGRVK
ncbi:MAG: hypothetical protein DGJ47_000130 [Rickettsiaceae bacterium]